MARCSTPGFAPLPHAAGPLAAGMLAAVLLAGCTDPREAQPEAAPADLILHNARVYTLDWGEPDPAGGQPAPDAPYDAGGWHPDAQALAVSGGRLLAVGGDREILGLAGETTEVVDLQGATVIPGLVDAHVHVVELGELLSRVNLTGVATAEAAVARVRAERGAVAPGEWIVGQGWDEGAWANRYPHRSLLDDAFPANPVYLRSLHGFAVWANGLALERAGIDASTPDPVGGSILRDENGEPTGILLNNATGLLARVLPEPSAAELDAFAEAGLARMARDGYVMVHQAGADRRRLESFQRLQRQGRLAARVYVMLSARDEALAAEWARRGPHVDADGWLDVRAVKAYYDGALGSRGARLLDDYSDRPGHRGVSGDGYGFNASVVRELLNAGFQIGIHAIGDAGNRETLDFLETALAENPAAAAQRHRIEHAQVISPADLPRFAALPVVASMQPPHAVEDKTWAEDRLGPERVRGAYAWRSLRATGARLVFSSDLPGSDHNIFYGLHAAITRRDRALEPPQGWHREQALTAEEALRAYTRWAAHAAFREAETGVLAPGRWADITVMDLDPLRAGESDPARLLEGRIVMTVAGGRVTYRR